MYIGACVHLTVQCVNLKALQQLANKKDCPQLHKYRICLTSKQHDACKYIFSDCSISSAKLKPAGSPAGEVFTDITNSPGRWAQGVLDPGFSAFVRSFSSLLALAKSLGGGADPCMLAPAMHPATHPAMHPAIFAVGQYWKEF